MSRIWVGSCCYNDAWFREVFDGTVVILAGN
jgi:hypothetical protein